MASRKLTVLSWLALALLPVLAEPIPGDYSPYPSYSSSTTSYYPSDTTSYYPTSSASSSSSSFSVSSISQSTKISESSTKKPSTSSKETATPTTETTTTLVTTAEPTGSPWSVSYSDYTSITGSQPPSPSASASGVRFHPDGSAPGFFCEYPSMPEYEPCNGPDSRDCWLRKKADAKKRCDDCYDTEDDPDVIDIHTDYENPARVPSGTVREYWIELDGDFILRADGFEKTTGKVFNKSFPAPLIEACWGDKVVIHVKNNYDQNGTTIHWHGIRQLGTNQMDGVPGVTQCPIAKGDSFTYEWQALQYGTTWYHSHYALQYSDGAVGPLVIHGPTSANWDIDLGPVLVQDYVHQTAFIAYQAEKTQTNFARADAIVVNGQGHDPATGTGSYFTPKLTPGKRHLVRVINSSAGTSFKFSIDEHPMKVVSNDLVAIEPFDTTDLTLGIGQRYSFVIEANQDPKNYWIRTHPATRCNGFAESLGTCNGTTAGAPGIFDDNCILFDIRTAIASYDVPNNTDTALPDSTPFVYSVACLDVPYQKLKPVVPWVVDNRPVNNITDDRFTIGRQNPNLPEEQYEPGGYQHWVFTPDFFWIDYDKPTVLNTSFQGDWEPTYHIVEEPFDKGFIFLIMEANALSPTPDNVSVIPISHPIHWHGHDVVLLAQNQSQFDPNESFAYFNFDNPPRRDVILLPETGYIAVAFRADNPGAWLIHCHIAWHSSAGLGMQNLESQNMIVSSLGGDSALSETKRVCDNWRAFNASNPVIKDESGV